MAKMAAISGLSFANIFLALLASCDLGVSGILPFPPDPKCSLPFPKSYVVYHLSLGEEITVDGKLDEKAWEEVDWTQTFTGSVPSISESGTVKSIKRYSAF